MNTTKPDSDGPTNIMPKASAFHSSVMPGQDASYNESFLITVS